MLTHLSIDNESLGKLRSEIEEKQKEALEQKQQQAQQEEEEKKEELLEKTRQRSDAVVAPRRPPPRTPPSRPPPPSKPRPPVGTEGLTPLSINSRPNSMSLPRTLPSRQPPRLRSAESPSRSGGWGGGQPQGSSKKTGKLQPLPGLAGIVKEQAEKKKQEEKSQHSTVIGSRPSPRGGPHPS